MIECYGFVTDYAPGRRMAENRLRSSRLGESKKNAAREGGALPKRLLPDQPKRPVM
jgi:hypothetical protein